MISLKLFLSSKNVSSKCIIVSLEQYLPWNTKKTKIVKIHVRFSFSSESSKLDLLGAQITSLNSS